MKPIALALVVGCLWAQGPEVVPLTAQETVQLSQLQTKVNLAKAETAKAQKVEWAEVERLCAAQAAIKKAHKILETSGSCGNGGWSSEMTTVAGTSMTTAAAASLGIMTGTGSANRSRWSFDKTLKYLISE